MATNWDLDSYPSHQLAVEVPGLEADKLLVSS